MCRVYDHSAIPCGHAQPIVPCTRNQRYHSVRLGLLGNAVKQATLSRSQLSSAERNSVERARLPPESTRISPIEAVTGFYGVLNGPSANISTTASFVFNALVLVFFLVVSHRENKKQISFRFCCFPFSLTCFVSLAKKKCKIKWKGFAKVYDPETAERRREYNIVRRRA